MLSVTTGGDILGNAENCRRWDLAGGSRSWGWGNGKVYCPWLLLLALADRCSGPSDYGPNPLTPLAN
jgi:hypothetical protein